MLSTLTKSTFSFFIFFIGCLSVFCLSSTMSCGISSAVAAKFIFNAELQLKLNSSLVSSSSKKTIEVVCKVIVTFSAYSRQNLKKGLISIDFVIINLRQPYFLSFSSLQISLFVNYFFIIFQKQLHLFDLWFNSFFTTVCSHDDIEVKLKLNIFAF